MEVAPIPRRQFAERLEWILDCYHRATRLLVLELCPLNDHRYSALLRYFAQIIVAVEFVPCQRDEQVAGLRLPRVGAHTRNRRGRRATQQFAAAALRDVCQRTGFHITSSKSRLSPRP